MTKFRKYSSVERWDHTEEIDGINQGWVHIQEKIDGANASVGYDDGFIWVAKRTGVIARCPLGQWWATEINWKPPAQIYEEFRGLPKHVFSNPKFFEFFEKYPEFILYGEWLVPHTVQYSQEMTNRFYIFDVYNAEHKEFLSFKKYQSILEAFDLPYIKLIAFPKENPSMESLLSLVSDKSRIPASQFGAEMIEGLVFKNYEFQNGFGRNVYMKATTKDFREKNAVIMGSNRFDPVEYGLINRHLANPRMEKIYHKMKDDHGTLDMRLTAEFLERVFYDLFHEEAWAMLVRDKKAKNRDISVRRLRRASYIKAKAFWIEKLREGSTKNGEK